MGINFSENHSLKQYNTFSVEVFARYFMELQSTSDIEALLSSTLYKEYPLLVLSGGSNMLFTQDFDGLVVRPLLMGIEVEQENSSEVVLKVGSGVVWDQLVEYCVAKGWGGLENLSGIPGLVGASPIQNIGAYGVEAQDTIEQVEAYHLRMMKKVFFSREECLFDYRDSVFKQQKGEYLISAVYFRLKKKPYYNLNLQYGDLKQEVDQLGETSLSNIRQAVLYIRQSKLPSVELLPNGGSFFKNPIVTTNIAESLQKDYPDIPHYVVSKGVKIPAAWLIEKAGWKGRQVGCVKTHDRQPLVIVNTGGATGSDIFEFSATVIKNVQEQFGITLEREINVI